MASKTIRADRPTEAQNVKMMFARIWAVAELLAQAERQEAATGRHRQASQKTQR
jgi:hypothetical protein